MAVAPVMVPVPLLTGQPVHSAPPVADLYLPAAQAAGVPPSTPVNPALAMQSVAASLPATLLLLAGHDPEQDVAVSVPALYVSAPQFSHVMPLLFRPGPHSFTQAPPLGPLQPDTQLQSVAASLPATLLLLAGQPVQDVAESVPALNVSESQFTQVVPLTFSPGPQEVTQSDSAVEPAPAVVLPAGQLHDRAREEDWP